MLGMGLTRDKQIAMLRNNFTDDDIMRLYLGIADSVTRQRFEGFKTNLGPGLDKDNLFIEAIAKWTPQYDDSVLIDALIQQLGLEALQNLLTPNPEIIPQSQRDYNLKQMHIILAGRSSANKLQLVKTAIDRYNTLSASDYTYGNSTEQTQSPVMIDSDSTTLPIDNGVHTDLIVDDETPMIQTQLIMSDTDPILSTLYGGTVGPVLTQDRVNLTDKLNLNGYELNHSTQFNNFSRNILSKIPKDFELDPIQEGLQLKMRQHQEVTRQYMSSIPLLRYFEINIDKITPKTTRPPLSPYRGCLFYHDMGTGKTLTGVHLAMGFIQDYRLPLLGQLVQSGQGHLLGNFQSEDRGKVVFMFYKRLKPTWEKSVYRYLNESYNMRQYFQDYFYPDGSSGSDEIMEYVSQSSATNFQKQKEEIAENDELFNEIKHFVIRIFIRDHFIFQTANPSSTLISELEARPLRHNLVIMDEIHNIIGYIHSGVMNLPGKPPGKTGSHVYKWLLDSYDTKIVGLSGTPIINYPAEILILANILRGKMSETIDGKYETLFSLDREQIERLIYDENDEIINPVLVSRRLTGLISRKIRDASPDYPVSFWAKTLPWNGEPVPWNDEKKELLNAETDEIIPLSIGNIRKIKIPMSEKQFAAYVKLRERPTQYTFSEKRHQAFAGQAFTRSLGICTYPLEKNRLYEINLEGGQTSSTSVSKNTCTRKQKQAMIQLILDRSKSEYSLFANRSETDQNKKSILLEVADDAERFINFICNTVFTENPDLFLAVTLSLREAEEDASKLHDESIFAALEMYRGLQPSRQFKINRFNYRVIGKDNEKRAMVETIIKYGDTPYSLYANRAETDKIDKKLLLLEDQVGQFVEFICGNILITNPDLYLPVILSIQKANSDISQLHSESVFAAIEQFRDLQTIRKFQPYPKSIRETILEIIAEDSPKIARIMSTIVDPDNEDLHFVYSRTKVYGAFHLEGYLQEYRGPEAPFGFKPYVFRIPIGITDPSSIAQLAAVEIANLQDRVANGERFYIKYTENYQYIRNGEAVSGPPLTVDELTDTINYIFNSEENKYGELIKVLVGTSKSKEGLDLRNVRQVYIMDPWWNMVSPEQAMGRAIRYLSHYREIVGPDGEIISEGFPDENDRYVKIDLLIGVMSEEQKLRYKSETSQSAETTTTDEFAFKKAIDKLETSRKLETILNHSAIDCGLYGETNTNDICDSLDKNTGCANNLASDISVCVNRYESTETGESFTKSLQNEAIDLEFNELRHPINVECFEIEWNGETLLRKKDTEDVNVQYRTTTGLQIQKAKLILYQRFDKNILIPAYALIQENSNYRSIKYPLFRIVSTQPNSD